MGSMNWLGFSLSPQEVGNQDEQAGYGQSDGFDLGGSDATAPSLNHHHQLPPPFGILEAFHRSADTQSHGKHPLEKLYCSLGTILHESFKDRSLLFSFSFFECPKSLIFTSLHVSKNKNDVLPYDLRTTVSRLRDVCVSLFFL